MMRKQFFPLLLLLGMGTFGYSQNTEAANVNEEMKPRPEKWQAGWVLSDIVMPNLSLEGGLMLNARNMLGYRATIVGMLPNRDFYLYNRILFGHYSEFHHKIFWSAHENSSFYLRHGPRLSFYNMGFPNTHWQPVERNGNTFLEYFTTQQRDQIIKMGYTLFVGYQNQLTKNLFIDYYFGVVYEEILNYDKLNAPKRSDGRQNSLESFEQPLWFMQGWRPALGVVLSFGR